MPSFLTPLRLVAFAAFAACAAALSFGVLSACERRCSTPANCLRSCDCLNAQTNNRFECTLAFRCDGTTETCESDFDELSCDEICQVYAARAQCGVSRCVADSECQRFVSCPVFSADGQPTGQFQDCAVSFACDVDIGACEARQSVSDAELCAGECFAAVGG